MATVLDTEHLTLIETRDAPFQALAPTLAITLPDGTTEASPPPVTGQAGASPVDGAADASADGIVEPLVAGTPGTPASPSQVQTLSAWYTPPQAGVYGLTWTYSDGANTISRTRSMTAFWSDVPDFVRELLQVNPEQLPDSVVEDEAARWLRLLAMKYPSLPVYGALTSADQPFVDEALAYLAAIALWPTRGGGASGAISSLKVGAFQFSYGGDARDERSLWTEQAAAALAKVSAIAVMRKAAAANVSLFAAAGRARRAPASGPYGTLDEVLYLLEMRLSEPALWLGGAGGFAGLA